MKEENKKEIKLINENFKKIEEGALMNNDMDINSLMRNQKNLINITIQKTGSDKQPQNHPPSNEEPPEQKQENSARIKVGDKSQEFAYMLKPNINLKDNDFDVYKIISKEMKAESNFDLKDELLGTDPFVIKSNTFNLDF